MGSTVVAVGGLFSPIQTDEHNLTTTTNTTDIKSTVADGSGNNYFGPKLALADSSGNTFNITETDTAAAAALTQLAVAEAGRRDTIVSGGPGNSFLNFTQWPPWMKWVLIAFGILALLALLTWIIPPKRRDDDD